MWPAFPTSDYYEDLRPISDAVSRRRTFPPPAWLAGGSGDSGDGSHVHHEPIGGVGARLCSCSLATGTPQAFPVASSPAVKDRLRSRPTSWACTAVRPVSARLEPVVLT